MEKADVLRTLNLGNSVAEQDKNLVKYFINMSYVETFLEDSYDIVKGVKGAGKTAMLVALCNNPDKYESLEDVKLIQAINIKGDPDFKRAFDQLGNDDMEMQSLIDSWKIYIINIVWKNITDEFSGYEDLEKYLLKNKLVTEKEGFLAKIIHSFKRTKVMITNTINTDGSYTQGIEFGTNEANINSGFDNRFIDYNYIFKSIDEILIKNNKRIWVMMDRLDDAFPDNTAKDIIALKSLLYAFKDICVYDNIKVKIFIRDDIYTTVTEKGFTSLTHVASKTMNSIEWDREKLEDLLLERLLFNDTFKQYLIENKISFELINEDSKKNIFRILFKGQVDVGEKNPDTIGWIINHIKDGTNTFTPRDFIAMIDAARRFQLEETKGKANSDSEDHLIGSTALRKAYNHISTQKLETQLYGEYPECREWILKFKDNKAEHNEHTLKEVLGKQWKHRIQKLVKIGFIEEKQHTWKIPFLYRAGLNITQGRAF
jgi:hypothetical protein